MRTAYLSFAIVTVMLAATNPLPAAAEDSGHWHGLSVLVATDKKVVKLEDQPNHMVYVTEYDGAVYNGDGKPFLDKARYQVVAFTDTAYLVVVISSLQMPMDRKYSPSTP